MMKFKRLLFAILIIPTVCFAGINWNGVDDVVEINGVEVGEWNGIEVPVDGDITYTFDGSGAISADWTEASGGANDVVRSSDIGVLNAQYDGTYYVYVWTTDTPANDQFSEFEWDANISSGSVLGPAVRYNAATNSGYYGFINSNGTVYIASVTSGTRSTITGTYSEGNTLAAGDIFKLVVSGTTITLYRNGTSIASGTDATYSSGNAGIMYRSSQATASLAHIDNFRAGEGNGL